MAHPTEWEVACAFMMPIVVVKLAPSWMCAGLAQNECLLRQAAGCRLLQIGEQSLGLGLKFRARVVLDIKEHPEGVPLQLIDDQVSQIGLSARLSATP